MSRGCFLALFVAAAFLPAVPALAQSSPDPAPAEAEQEIPGSIRNNQYLVESQRLASLAQETYQYGDYDLSASLAEEAIRYAELSDEYVTLQMKILAANEAIATAKDRLDWAASSGTSGQYPSEYGEAETLYGKGLEARSGEDWDEAYNAAQRAIDLLAYIQSPAGSPARAAPGTSPLPATYTVRQWNSSRDCFWNIAARPWVYGDGQRWRVLYNANKSRLPDPDNPNLIEPGMVIEIPSIRGETRQGAWEPNASY